MLEGIFDADALAEQPQATEARENANSRPHQCGEQEDEAKEH
jgi:hypothetical protein